MGKKAFPNLNLKLFPLSNFSHFLPFYRNLAQLLTHIHISQYALKLLYVVIAVGLSAFVGEFHA